MRTTLRVETPNKVLEVELRLVNGKQVVELELADLLALIDGKRAKASSNLKQAKVQTVPKGTKMAKENPSGSAKRGRKPRSGGDTPMVNLGLES